jgi:hypothetical protein
MSSHEEVRFKELLKRVLEKSELNGRSPYKLIFATKNSNSGRSFGIPQYDLSEGNEQQGQEMGIQRQRSMEYGA